LNKPRLTSVKGCYRTPAEHYIALFLSRRRLKTKLKFLPGLTEGTASAVLKAA
jgi:hypothetical protein